jgi:hypothetical protein
LVQNLNLETQLYLNVLSFHETVEIQWLALELYKNGKAEYQFQGLTRPKEGYKLTSMLLPDEKNMLESSLRAFLYDFTESRAFGNEV